VDLLRQNSDHDLVVQRSETVGDIPLDEPRRARPIVGHLPQRGVAAPAGPISVRVEGELRLVVRLQQQAYHLTDQLVRPRGQPQRAKLPVLFGDLDPSHRRESVALVAHRLDDGVDFRQGHAVRGFLADPGRHRALVGVDAPVGQQIQLRVEQLSIQLVTRQPSLAALTQDTQHRLGALHSAYLPVLSVSESPAPLRPVSGVTVSLAGRDSRDYYGRCVAIGLAPHRRSHVRLCRTYLA
jgi:hypothetical protein